MKIHIGVGVTCLQCVEEHGEKANMIMEDSYDEKNEYIVDILKCPVCGIKVEASADVNLDTEKEEKEEDNGRKTL